MSLFDLRKRLKIALGGFLSFIGLVILSLVFMVITGKLDIENALQSELHQILVSVILVIGSLDILAGILLARSR